MNKVIDPSVIQHYSVWHQFNQKIYHKVLTAEDIICNGNEKYIDSVFSVVKSSAGVYSVEEDKPVNTKCIFLEKNGIKYILPSCYKKHLPLEPIQSFECYLKQADKTIHTFITKPETVGITAEQSLSFKDLVKLFNPVNHTDLQTLTFLKIQAIGSKAKGGKYRLCSPPATMKNANDVILHSIFNNNVRVSKATLAKLETLFYYNQKVLPDEMTSLTPAQVREVEPFFLTLADENPVMNKHSMAKNKDLNTIDLSQSSCVFTYNDVSSIAAGSKFFDDIWQSKEAFDSRYPAFLLKGEVTTGLPKLSNTQANKLMVDNFDTLRLIAKNLAYYMENMSTELNHWSRQRCKFKGRHRVNIECILDALDVYSQSQQEFDDWLVWLDDRATVYQEMVKQYTLTNPVRFNDTEKVVE